jgi:sec-independent protein translocase protein TatA
MPNIGPMELILILAIALLVLGPGKLPEVGKSLGASIREFRKATTDIQEAVKLDPTPAPPTTTAPAAAPVASAVPAPNTLSEGASPNQLSATGPSSDEAERLARLERENRELRQQLSGTGADPAARA